MNKPFFQCSTGGEFQSDKHSEPGVMIRYIKIGDTSISEQRFFGFYQRRGNARRAGDGVLKQFAPEDLVQPI